MSMAGTRRTRKKWWKKGGRREHRSDPQGLSSSSGKFDYEEGKGMEGCQQRTWAAYRMKTFPLLWSKAQTASGKPGRAVERKMEARSGPQFMERAPEGRALEHPGGNLD